MSNYYLEHKAEVLKQHQAMAGLFCEILESLYGKEKAKAYTEKIQTAFIDIIPNIPYIGGNENRMTETVVQVATPLAIYRVLKAEGKPVAEIGEIVYKTAQAWVNQYPQFMRRIIGWYFLSGFSKHKMEKAAEASKQSPYEDDFVYEVVEGDEIHWGINYHQCAIVKWFAKMDASEFAPYMCRLDWVMYAGLEIHLERSQTIANGASHCDFRFVRKAKAGKSENTWGLKCLGINCRRYWRN